MAIYEARIFVPSDLLEALGEHTGHYWSDPRLEPIIHDAIRAWMNPAPAAAAVQQQPAACSEAGYQWKQVFLPEGTRLRACFGRQPYFAVVEGAQIKYGADAVSPSGFANLRGSGNRNAWKAVWLRFPGSEEWLLADVCRSARKAAIARLPGGDVQQESSSRRTRAAAPPRPAACLSWPPQNEIRSPSKSKRGKSGSGRGRRRKHKRHVE